ncbi:transcription factor bHLH162-like [Cucurbita pepo subsp. pepo]|uniref:transcription factor bHLH162-like n=1 Tax=Cucurbita pepo subsp. pepo TaxID=3664 RepID=UPI000C9D779E|nr:transcription factor bHLH162-like [Cucurbita pepo subsp. pepo]
MTSFHYLTKSLYPLRIIVYKSHLSSSHFCNLLLHLLLLLHRPLHQMDRHFQFSTSSSSAAKIERRIVEKNRRNQMKTLCSQLNSLLPNQDSKEISLALPDQIDEAVKYIKELEKKVNLAKEKKEKLEGKNKSSMNIESSSSSSASPQLKIHQSGRSLEIILSSGLDNQYLFSETISILQEEGVEVVNASFSVSGSSVFQTFHAQLEGSMIEFEAAKVTERLKRLVYGSNSDMELQKEKQWWDEFPSDDLDY